MLAGPNRDTWHVGFSYVSSVTKGPLIGSRTRVGSVGKSPVQVSGLETMSRSCQSPKFMPEPWIRHSIRPLAFRPVTTAAAALGLANTWSRANLKRLPGGSGTRTSSLTSASCSAL